MMGFIRTCFWKGRAMLQRFQRLLVFCTVGAAGSEFCLWHCKRCRERVLPVALSQTRTRACGLCAGRVAVCDMW